MTKIKNDKHDNDTTTDISCIEKKITREEFARSLTRSLRQFLPILLGQEKPKGNIREKIAKWKKLAEEVDDE